MVYCPIRIFSMIESPGNAVRAYPPAIHVDVKMSSGEPGADRLIGVAVRGIPIDDARLWAVRE
jgi:hypothetical protein